MNARIADISNGETDLTASAVTRDQVKTFIRNETWGHHASCTCPMGPAGDPNAVVDSSLRVYGTSNLRIVDASIFPRIPGYFILMPIFMMSEKAGDMIRTANPFVAEASDQISVTRGGFRRNRATGRYVQEVTLTNNGVNHILGPVSLVLDGMSSNASLLVLPAPLAPSLRPAARL